MSGPAVGKRLFLVLWLPAGLLFLFAGFCFAITPYALREIWLPAAARSAGAVIRADDLRLKSLFPFCLKAVNLYYSDPEVELKIRRGVSVLDTGKLKKHRVELNDTQIDGISIVVRPPGPEIPPSGAGKTSVRPEEEAAPWSFSMKKFRVKNGMLEFRNRDGRAAWVWKAKELSGDRFLSGEKCRLHALASVSAYPDRRSPLRIPNLPFRLKAEYLTDADFQLKEFSLALNTGICSLFVTDEIVIPAEAGISARVRLKGDFPDPDTLRITSSEAVLFKKERSIGKMDFKGSFGKTFRCEGAAAGLDLEPCLSIFAPGSNVRLKVPEAEFSVTGSDFSPEGLRRDLKARLIARLEELSIPVELDRQSRILRLIMIPVEAMPTLVELLELSWNFRHEFDQCLNSVRAIVSGRQNLNFDRARLDISLEEGLLKISDITLNGKDIEMESIKGVLNLGTEALDIRTVLLVKGVRLPLKFKGTLNQPSARLKDVLKDFVLLNAPLLDRLEKLLTEPPSKNDSKLEKSIKRGYRDLNRMLQQ